VRLERFNPQTQPRFVWPASFPVARAYIDQLRRGSVGAADVLTRVADELARAEGMQAGEDRNGVLTQLASTVEGMQSSAQGRDAERVRALVSTLRDLAAAR
jgi:hypothetical protein